ncbi:MAG: SusC/RagA family TonB-linked outer membrane protein [Prolixibacteraceae bacterium]|nr:SusC/RagA family TonB-linked outer membrane protein [Prolixibacteraceae bacterium]
MEKATVREVLSKIEDQSEFNFMYSSEVVDVTRLVSINVKDAKIDEVLKSLFVGTEVGYTIKDRLVVLNLLDVSTVQQQSLSVSGRVTDSSGAPLPGVTVAVKGTTRGIITDSDGKYTLSDVSSNGALVFSFMGMKSQEIIVSGNSLINVTMTEETIGVDEVVVTAFGITRTKKQLTYSTQQIDGELLSNTGNVDAAKGLQGKVAGVTVRQLSGAPGRGASIRIRGSNSLKGSNDPLYVVDGSPVVSDVASQMSPNEIESIDVLKGATAAALYGLRASNGVILITTKRGAKNELNKPTISINSSYSFDRLAVNPETQKIYGQGVNYNFDPYSSFSYGPKISEWGTYINQLGEEEVAKAYDNVKDLFQTGGTQNHNVNISNRFEKGNFSIGVGYSGQEGIVPNSDFYRVTAKFATDYEITKKIKISTSVNYSNSEINIADNNGNIFYAAFNAPPSYNLKGKPTHVEGNPYQQINFRGQHDNIYWALDNNNNNSNQSTLLGSIGINYEPVKWLNLSYRIGLDENSAVSRNIYEVGSADSGGMTVPPSGGRVIEIMGKTASINSTFIATTNHKITDKLDLEVMVGNEFYNYNYKQLKTQGDKFTIPGFHHLSNCANIISSQYWGKNRNYAFFGNINMYYAKMISLTITGRNDVVSNMPRDNRSFFYPSVGLGFIFTEAMDVPDFLTFGKIRASYAEVGQAGDIYSTSTVYGQSSAYKYSFPYNGINAFNLSSELKSTDLKPENTKGWEIGANLIFFNNRINLDYTYYNSKSEGQIFSVPISGTTGFTSEVRNAGEMVNQGHEIVLQIKPIVTENFNWELSTNFTAYTNKVIKLAEGVDELTVGGNPYVAYAVAREGESYPVLRGYGYARDQNGKIVVSDIADSYSYGMPLRSAASDVILGKLDPDFEINFINTFRYKNISLYAQIDWREGGVTSSGDSRLAKLYGTHYDTQFREENYVVPNAVVGHYDNTGNLVITGVENEIVIKRDYDYWRRVMDGIGEQNVYDASYIRVRELKISYDLPNSFLQKINISKASVSLIGRNLWLLKSGLPHYDPEMNSSSGNDYGVTYLSYPQVSNYGFSVNLIF